VSSHCEDELINGCYIYSTDFALFVYIHGKEKGNNVVAKLSLMGVHMRSCNMMQKGAESIGLSNFSRDKDTVEVISFVTYQKKKSAMERGKRIFSNVVYARCSGKLGLESLAARMFIRKLLRPLEEFWCPSST